MIGTTQRQMFTKILGASIVLHLGAVILFFVIADAHSKPEPKTVIATKLVRLGKERPKELLPRLAKEAPPPPTPSAPPPVPKPKPPEPSKAKPVPKAKPPAKPAPKPAAKPAASQPSKPSVSSALSRLKSLTSAKGDEVPEGVEDGSVLGEAAKRVLGNRYVGEVYTRFKAAYALEGIDAQNPALAGKSVVIAVWISRRGTVQRSKVLKASGVEAFDRSVEKTLKRVRDVPAPPREIWELVSDGIEIEFSPR